MAQETYLKVAGVWKQIVTIWRHNGTIWKNNAVSWIKAGGIWRQCHVLPATSYSWSVAESEGYTISNQTHGMSDGSNTFNLSFDHTYSGDVWKYWAIRVNGSTYASGSGNPNGVRLRTGITATKAGTLSANIQTGDSVVIQIGLGEA